MQPLPAQQSFLQAVPVSELDKGRVLEPQFVAERALRAFGHIVGQLIALEVDAGNPPDHPAIELFDR